MSSRYPVQNRCTRSVGIVRCAANDCRANGIKAHDIGQVHADTVIVDRVRISDRWRVRRDRIVECDAVGHSRNIVVGNADAHRILQRDYHDTDTLAVKLGKAGNGIRRGGGCERIPVDARRNGRRISQVVPDTRCVGLHGVVLEQPLRWTRQGEIVRL